VTFRERCPDWLGYIDIDRFLPSEFEGVSIGRNLNFLRHTEDRSEPNALLADTTVFLGFRASAEIADGFHICSAKTNLTAIAAEVGLPGWLVTECETDLGLHTFAIVVVVSVLDQLVEKMRLRCVEFVTQTIQLAWNDPSRLQYPHSANTLKCFGVRVGLCPAVPELADMILFDRNRLSLPHLLTGDGCLHCIPDCQYWVTKTHKAES